MGSQDRRYEAENKGSEDSRESSRRHLSEQASRIDARDRVNVVPNADDRAAFRSDCASHLAELRQELRTASKEMGAANAAGMNGKRPGSPEFDNAFQSALKDYATAMKKASAQLYETNPDGSKKIDPITDRPVPSDLAKGIYKERALLSQEMGQLDQMKRSGQRLTPEQQKQFGVNTDDPKTAYDLKKADDRMLRDFQRAAGYAEANYGLALVGSSEWFQGQQRQQQLDVAKELISRSKEDAPFNLHQADAAHPNANDDQDRKDFQDAVSQVSQMAGIKPGDLGIDSGNRTTDNTNGNGQQALDPSQIGPRDVVDSKGQHYVADGPFTLPNGNVDALRTQNFEDPTAVLNANEQKLSNPLSQANIDAYERAIKDADSIDRIKLVKDMAAQQDYVDKALANKELKATWDNYNKVQDEITGYSQLIQLTAPQLASVGDANQQAKTKQIITDLGNLDSVDKINQYKSQHADDIRAFEGVQIKDASGKPFSGADFISTVQKYANDMPQQQNLTNQLNRLDPNFLKAQDQIDTDMRLYHSSEDTRAHYLNALVSSKENQSPQNIARARQLAVELSQMDANLASDPEFQKLTGKQALNIPADQLASQPTRGGQQIVPGFTTGADAALQPTDNTNGGNGSGQTSELTQAQVESVAKAAQIYTQIKNGQAKMDDAAMQTFKQALSDAQGISPQAIQSKQAEFSQTLQQAGWTKQMEDQLQAAGNDNAKIQAVQQQNPQAFQARQKFEQQMQALGQLAHAQPIIEGLMGTAMYNAGQQDAARQYLADAAKDGTAATMDADVAKAIQASRVADQGQQRTSTDKTGGTTDNTNGQGSSATVLDNAVKALAAANAAVLAQISQKGDGNPLSAEKSKVYQDAIAAASQVDASKLATEDQMIKQFLPNWTKAQEDARTKAQADVEAAANGLSKNVNDAVGKLGNGATKDQVFATIQGMAGNDATAATFVKAIQSQQDFYKQNPDANKRDLIEHQAVINQQLQHGKAIAESQYAAALLSTGNAQDQAKAVALMNDAGKDAQLAQVYPLAGKVQELIKRGAAADSQQAAAAWADSHVPGWTQLKQAAAIMSDASLSPADRMLKADPLFQQAVDKAKVINLSKLDNDLKGTGAQMNMIAAQHPGMSMQQIAAADPNFAKLADTADKLSKLRLEPMKSNMLYAIALNQTAHDLQEAAAKDPKNKAVLEAQAKQYNEKAAAALQNIGKMDPTYGNDPKSKVMVDGAIQQVQKGEQIDPSRSTALGFGGMAAKVANTAVEGPARPLQPIWTSANMVGSGLQELGKHTPIPVVGPMVEGLGAGLTFSDKAMPAAIQAMAMAKGADPKTAEELIGLNKHAMLNQGVGMVNDLATTGLSLTAANMGTMPLLEAIGMDNPNPWVRGGTFATIGVLSAMGIRTGLDHGAHALVGTDTHSLAENMSRGAFDFAAGATAQGATKYLGQLEASALSQGAVKTSLVDAFIPSRNAAANIMSEAMTVQTAERNAAGQTVTKDITASPLFKEQYAQLPAATQEKVGSALAKAMESNPNMTASQQYKVMMGAVDEARTKAATELFSKLNPGRYSSAWRSGAAADEITARAGALENPWTMGMKGADIRGWDARGIFSPLAMSKNANLLRVGVGATAAGGYGFVENSPLVDKNNTWKGAFVKGGEYAVAGGTAGLALPYALNSGGMLLRTLPRAATTFGIGGTASALYGMGGDNFILGNDSVAGTFKHAGENFLVGGGASYIGGAIAPKVLEWGIAKPVKGLFKAGGWAFDTDAPAVARTAYQSWSPEGFWALGARQTAIRSGVGFVGAGGIGFIANSPIVDKHNTWAGATKAGGEWGLGGAVIAGGAPYGAKIANEGWQRYGRPAVETGHDLLNAGRRGLGRGVQAGWNRVAGDGTFIGDKIVTPIDRVTGATATGANSFSNRVAPYTAGLGRPLAYQWSTAGSGFYGIYEWNKLDKMSDQALAATRAQQHAGESQAAKTKQQPVSTEQPVPTEQSSQANTDAVSAAQKASDNGGSTQTDNNQNGAGTIGNMVSGG